MKESKQTKTKIGSYPSSWNPSQSDFTPNPKNKSVATW